MRRVSAHYVNRRKSTHARAAYHYPDGSHQRVHWKARHTAWLVRECELLSWRVRHAPAPPWHGLR